jgi:hypothetical protein
MLLEHMGRASESWLVLAEALPGPDELWAVDDDDNRYASEVVMELYRRDHGRYIPALD